MYVLERDYEANRDFYNVLQQATTPVLFGTMNDLLVADQENPSNAILLDVATLRDASIAQLTQLYELRGTRPIGLLTDLAIEHYFSDLRRHNIYQLLGKIPNITTEEVERFLFCIENPRNGFGLSAYLYRTSELHTASVRTIADKTATVETVINHFATNGFEIHELYNVRLILEETLNNAIFHAFRDAGGEEKYHINEFKELDEGEEITVEYGSSSTLAGFTVTDSAGGLSLRTVLERFERQLSHDGLFDERGRGIFLSHQLSSTLVLNLDEGRCTQVIALFDEPRQKRSGTKPFIVNRIGGINHTPLLSELDLD